MKETISVTTIYTLETINDYQKHFSIIIKQKVRGNNQRPQYQLLNQNGLDFKLTNGQTINIPQGFIWDGSSTPRFLWSIMGTDGDFEIASLIHDYLYEKRYENNRKFADKEMLLWSKAVNGTLNKWSFRNLDNWLRYYAVRWFGNHAWKT